MAADLTLQEILKSPIHFSCFAGLCQLHGYMPVLTLLREIDAYSTLPRSAREARALSILKDIASSVASSPDTDKFFQLVGCSSSTDMPTELQLSGSPGRSRPLFDLPQPTYDLIVARMAQRDFSPHLFVDVRKLVGALLESEVLPVYIRYRNERSSVTASSASDAASSSSSSSSDEEEAYWRKSLRNLKFWKRRSPTTGRARSTVLTGSEGRIPSSSTPPSMVSPLPHSHSTPRSNEISSKSLSQIFEGVKARTSSNENSPSTENSNSPQSSVIRSRSRSVEFPESDGDPDDLSRFLIFRNQPANLEFEFCTRQHQRNL